MIFRNRVKAIIFLLLTASLLTGCFTRVPPEPRPPSHPTIRAAFFAPNGKSIFLVFKSRKIYGLFRADLNGKVTTWLYKGLLYEPIISPDGNTLVFVLANKKDRGDLWAMDADGRNLHQLTSDSDFDRKPRFSHDGKRIYFLRHDSWGSFPSIDREEGWDSDIFYLDLATGKIHRLTDQKFSSIWSLSIYPDDHYMLIGTPEYLKNGYSLWKTSLDDPKKRWPVEPIMRRYAANPAVNFHEGQWLAAVYHVILSRDGRYLLFAWQDPEHLKPGKQETGDQSFVCSMSDMLGKKIVHDQPFSYPLDISRNNQWILFAGPSNKSRLHDGVLLDGNLWMVRRDGSGLTNLKLDFRGVLDKPPVSVRRR